MRKRKFICFAAMFLCLGLLATSNILALDATNIKLSYKMLESQNDGNTLTMKVKLKAKNTTADPIYNLSAINTYTENITIGASQIEIGDIEAGKTADSAESFIITMNIPEGEQGEPQKAAVWQVEYEDADGNIVVEEVLLQ